jgi:hypothetical protein
MISGMSVRPYNVLVRTVLVVLGAGCGLLLYSGANWLVGHDSINYKLSASKFAIISDAAETAFALGPELWTVAGLMLALPLLLGCVRRVVSFWKLVVLHALAYLMLVCGLGSFRYFPFVGCLGVTALVWILGVIWASFCETQTSPENVGSGAPSVS